MTEYSHHTLERLKEQRAKIDARIQASEARLKQSHRKQETRCKILIGSYYLDKAMKENTMNELKKLMAGYLTRESDKKLFDISEEQKAQEKQKTEKM
jgi:hypothetical protein